jgi:DNA (cytosine-5)-methyltransferase 1
MGRQLQTPSEYDEGRNRPLVPGGSWPKAAWGRKGEAYRVEISAWPERRVHQHLADFLRFDPMPLSARATEGFLKRIRASRLTFPRGFEDDIVAHLGRVRPAAALA